MSSGPAREERDNAQNGHPMAARHSDHAGPSVFEATTRSRRTLSQPQGHRTHSEL
ncbi:hypothetical protein [Trichothermofontia sp.]